MNNPLERTSVFLKTNEGRKEQIIKAEKKLAIVNGVNIALDLLGFSETKTIKIYPSETRFSEQEKTERISILIRDNGIHTTIIYPTGIRIDYNRSKKNLPKKSSIARFTAEAWAFGKHQPAPIAAYIEKKFKECTQLPQK